MVEILGVYGIFYERSITQVKNLIRQEDYENEIKPIYNEIYALEIERLSKNKKSSKYKELSKAISTLQKSISYLGNFFTTDSPLGKAIYAGKLVLPKCQGGEHNVIVVSLN